MSPTAATTRRVHRDEPHFLAADDGTGLTLIRVSTAAEPVKGPVMLVHGAGMRAEGFRPPAVRSLVDTLLDDGWDVWMLNWRGSIDLDPVPWTLDDVARYDHPAAVRYILQQTGASSIKAVAHCQGSVSLSMAAVAGLVPEVDTIVSNSVSLHPVVPRFAKVKLQVLRPLMGHRTPFVDVAWGDGPERGLARLTRNVVRVWHAECGSATCNMASFALGSGHPALWRHENLDAATHAWLSREFGKVPFSFYTQLATSERAKQIVSVFDYDGLPGRYADRAPRTEARFTLITGDRNRAFLPASQRATHAYLERHQPGRHTLRVIPGYSHADVIVGRRAHVDVFPHILDALNR